MKDHESSICSISLHASGRHAVTTANEIAQIWDLDTFTKKKTLNGAQTVGIQQVGISQVHFKDIFISLFVIHFSLCSIFITPSITDFLISQPHTVILY